MSGYSVMSRRLARCGMGREDRTCGSAITAIRPMVGISIGPDSTRPPRVSASLMVWSTSGVAI